MGGQRPAAARRPVRARRQQLHPRLPRCRRWPTCSRRSSSPASLNGRSARRQSVFIRPANSVNVQRELLHARQDAAATTRSSSAATGTTRYSYSTRRTPAATRRRASRPTPTLDRRERLRRRSPTGCQVQLTRDGQSVVRPAEHLASTCRTRSRTAALTLQLGLRYDYNHDRRCAASVAGEPARARPCCRRSASPAPIRASTFNNFSPRLGFTYDLTGDGKTIARANYARYYGQVGTGAIAGQLNPVGATTLRYPWIDANHDKSCRPNEIVTQRGATALSASDRQLDPANPANAGHDQHGRSEPEERRDRRVHRRRRSRDRRRLRGRAPTTSGAGTRTSSCTDRQRASTTARLHGGARSRRRRAPARRHQISAATARRSPTTSRTFQLPTVINADERRPASTARSTASS